MKSFRGMFIGVLLAAALIFAAADFLLYQCSDKRSGRPYRVEIGRIVSEIEEKGPDGIDLSEWESITGVEKYAGDDAGFYHAQSDYVIREIGGELYRIDYADSGKPKGAPWLVVNGALAGMTALLVFVLLYVRSNILKPFDRMRDMPYELSKGNLTVPLKESRSKFFGKFVWGIDLLRENMEEQKRRELELEKEKKTLLLSLSHDLRTPLSAIKLYAKALAKGLYADRDQQLGAAEKINEKADEIEDYVAQIVSAAREDFLNPEVKTGEFYLSEIMEKIAVYYTEKLSLIKTDFRVEDYSDCLLRGDADRGVEVLQNLMENAIKYGDGERISIGFSEEEGCRLIAVKNSGCTLPKTELPHIFDSFWRGSNAGSKSGSGLGLYICRQLMNRMGGEIFAEIRDETMSVTAVFVKAV